MKLLSRSGNTKLDKTNKENSDYIVAGLSLLPNIKICSHSKIAECLDPCLKDAGLAKVYKSVNIARQKKTDFYLNNKDLFFKQLENELINLIKYCDKHDKKPACRLNVLSDILYERTGIIDKFPEILFFDYTKVAARLGNTPENYKLIFSYSGTEKYRPSVEKALKHDNPIAVVFKNRLPNEFLNRPVINGDKSDLINVLTGDNKIIGLKAKGPAKTSDSAFIVNPDLIIAA